MSPFSAMGTVVFLVSCCTCVTNSLALPKIARGANEIWNTFRDSINDVFDCISLNRPPTLADVKFYLYTQKCRRRPEEIKDLQINKTVTFDAKHPVKIIIHGYTQSSKNEHFIKMKEAYLNVEDLNVIMVDWENLAFSSCYPVAADNAAFVGQLTGYLLERLDPDKIHIVGFSLGAHIAGIGAQMLGKKIHRITGLDPAGPMFVNNPTNTKLDKDDAKNVDVIHTSRAGVNYDVGHADFYVNGGKSQPECSTTDIGCSHRKCLELYLSSILHNVTFPALKCDSLENFEEGKCSNNTHAFMGEPWLVTGAPRGRFYLKTEQITTTSSSTSTITTPTSQISTSTITTKSQTMTTKTTLPKSTTVVRTSSTHKTTLPTTSKKTTTSSVNNKTESTWMTTTKKPKR